MHALEAGPNYDEPSSPGRVKKRMAQRLFGELLARGMEKLPEYVIQRIKDNNQAVIGLDPDLVANKAFSLSTKVRMQRERNIQRSIEATLNQNNRSLLREEFMKKFGFDLW
jgi:hypothetical protein